MECAGLRVMVYDLWRRRRRKGNEGEMKVELGEECGGGTKKPGTPSK